MVPPCTEWILCLNLQQVEGIKQYVHVAYIFIYLKVTVYDRIPSNQFYIHREAHIKTGGLFFLSGFFFPFTKAQRQQQD